MTDSTRSLSQFIESLCAAESVPRAIKDMLLQTDPAWLRISTPSEMAQLLAFLVVFADADNGNSTTQGATNRALSKAEQDLAWKDAFSTHPFKSVALTAKGEVRRKGETAPMVEDDPKKVAGVLAQPWAAARATDFTAYADSKEFREAQANICSHPVKLSNGQGSGGYVKQFKPLVAQLPMMVTEEDFTTRATRTLTCTAAYQRHWHVLLPWLDYQGSQGRLPDLLRNDPQLRAAVQAEFEAHGVAGGQHLLGALCDADKRPSMYGDPQVFAGDLPVHDGDAPVERLSVLAPFSMFAEMRSAKDRLADAFRAEVEEELTQVRAELKGVEAQIETLKAAKPKGKDAAAKAAHTEALQKWTSRRAKLLAQEKELDRKFLSIRAATVMVGGSTPRNVAMDLGTDVHTANVRVPVPFIRQAHVDLDAAVAYVEQAQLADVTPPRGDAAPRYLLPGAATKPHKDARRALFTELALQALEPLLALQDHWQARLSDLALAKLHERDADHIALAQGPWQFFVVGDPAVSTVEAREVLEPLARAVASRVTAALGKAFKSKPWSTEYALDVLQAVTDLVMHERA